MLLIGRVVFRYRIIQKKNTFLYVMLFTNVDILAEKWKSPVVYNTEETNLIFWNNLIICYCIFMGIQFMFHMKTGFGYVLGTW